MPDIYGYDDYRAFLRDWLAEKPSRSMQGLARRLGCSKSLVSMVCSGARDLQVGSAALWALELRLAPDEAHYWQLLVQEAVDHAPDLRHEAHLKRTAIQDWKRAVATTPAYRLYGDWVCPAILEMSRCPGFRPDPGWIAGRLLPEVPVQRVESALEVLYELGLLVEREGGLHPVHDALATAPDIDDEALSSLARALHRETLRHVGDALDQVPQHERVLTSMTVALPRARLSALADALRKMQIEVLQDVEHHRPDQVYQLTVALVPLTVPPDETP